MLHVFIMCGVIALVFIATTAAEVVVLVKVGSLIGALATFGVIITTGFLGAFLAKRAGVVAMRRLRDSFQQGGTGVSEALVNGALVLAAGVTLLSPGFITDAVGLALLVAPIRGVVAKAITARLRARAGGFIDIGAMPFSGDSFSASSGGGDVAGQPADDDEDPPPPGVIDV